MFRKGLSFVFLILLALALVACRRGGEGAQPTVTLPTVAATAPATMPATVVAATSTVATAVPAVSPTNTTTPTRPATAVPATSVPATATATTAPPTAVPPTAVPPTATVSAGPPPGGSARIQFAPGATSAIVQSRLAANGDTDTWILRVMAGQVVTVQAIANPPGNINLMLGDMTGGVLATSPDTTGVSAAVPATGDYQINLSTASGAPAVGYTMQVFIPAGGGITPTRLQFAPGQSAVQRDDVLEAGGDIDQFVVSMAAGQQLSVGVFASTPAVTRIFIRDTAGRLVASGTDMSGGVGVTTTAAGDYTIDISSQANAPRILYTLTVTAPPINPPPEQPTRLQFAPGQSSLQVSDSLPGGNEVNRYVINLAANQGLGVGVFASTPAVTNIWVYGPDGGMIGYGTDMSGVSTTTAQAGDHIIWVSTIGAAPAISYTMTVTAPPLNPSQPTRIQFAPGQSSAQVSDSLAAGGDINRYVLQLGANQQFTVAVFASTPAVTSIYVRDTAGRNISSGTDMSGVVAATTVAGDYYIDVSSTATAPALSYTMTVTAPPTNPPPPVEPIRINFGPGQTSAAFNGQVAVGLPPVEYVIRLLGGQTLITNVNDNPQANADVTVRDMAGNVLNFGRAPTSLGTQIPTTGDYLIVLSTMSTNAVSYSLEVGAPPLPQPGTATRIEFAPEATSATVTGDLPFGGDVDHWVIRALAGQTMNLSFGLAETGWLDVFVYNSAGQLIGIGSDITGVAAPMTTTGDYTIVVASDPAIGPLSYSMVVDIQ
ncbi:hypothetical protein [Promineifilum sp.]|uniref:hypothetical protein n=1 Tax=Promineifilum sp. TaxID=2664178 RepID=UPI0035B4B047